MQIRPVFAIGLCLLAFPNWGRVIAAPQSVHPSVGIRHLLNTSGSRPVRIARYPRDNTLYYLKQSGSIYRVSVNPGSGTSTSTLVFGSSDHGISSASGLAFGPDGTLYVVGNTTTNNSTFATIRKGVVGTGGGRTWSTLARTEPYPRSRTAFDHVFNGIIVSPDGQFVFLNSGSRTDHGEEQSVNGAFPGAREVPLTAKIFRVPAGASNLVLSNDLPALQSGGYIFAEGIRNTYDFAFASNGDLFGTENGPDRDMSEELNWLREGGHYGFPWRIGGTDNPQQFPDYDPAADLLLDSRFIAVQSGYYRNDPAFPPPPATFTEPVINLGPDADSFRDPSDGSIKDASNLGQSVGSFTAHRSPLGLVFDLNGVLTPEFRHHGFVLSWTPGDPSGDGVAGPFQDPSQDLLDLDLTKLGSTNYQMRARRIVGGFSNPIDAEIIDNRIYVIEYGGAMAIWEVTLPVSPTVTTAAATSVNDTAATLNGSVNPNGADASAWFEWGADTGYGSATLPQSVGSGTGNVELTASLDGLASGTEYHFRAVASNAFLVVYGPDRSFLTTAGNQAPVAQEDNQSTPEDSALMVPGTALLANDTDADPGDILSLVSVSPTSAQMGAVNLTGGIVTYSPATNFFGNDSFTYVIRDAPGLTATGTVRVTVAPVNDPPIAIVTSPALNAAFTSGSVLAIAATASDVDGNVASVVFHIDPGPTLSATNLGGGGFGAWWTNVGAGSYAVVAEAVDDQNSTNLSVAVGFLAVDLRLGVPAFTGNAFEFGLTGAAGNSFRVDASSNFLDWDPIATVLATNGAAQVSDAAATNGLRRYYRAVAP